MTRVLRFFAIGVLHLLLVNTVAWAQGTAQLNGRVADESGAVLPGVTVTVTQTDTRFTRNVVTDETGAYVITNLPTGPYRLEVSLQGFRTYVQTGIVLQVGATPTINAVLAVGNLAETVSVEAAAPLVDVRSAGISSVVEQERIVELPLQGRQVTDLIILAGGAVSPGRPNSRSFQGGVDMSVAGGLAFGVAYVLDGAMHNNVQVSSGLPLPFPDALQEFSVATSGLAAQNGMHAGASVSAVTKSGTNILHGNAFEFLRDSRFNATNPFAAIGPDGRRLNDGLRRNQFGGTLGGPIVRDRLFFFGAYQGTETRQTPVSNIAFVPTAAMLAGDFTAFASPACNVGRQVTLRAPFVGNQVDPRLFSPAALNLVSRLPKADNPCGETRFGLSNDRSEGQAVGRVDYQWSADHSVFGRYMATFDKSPSGLSKSDNILASALANIDNLAQSLTLGDTRVFGANRVNSLRFAFNRTAVNRFNTDYFTAADLGVKGVPNLSPTREMQFVITNGFTISPATATRGLADNNAFQVSDDLVLVRGRHQIALGANVAYWRSKSLTYARSSGTFNFNGQATGSGLSDFLVGRVSNMNQGGPVGLEFHQWYPGFYAQDAWRVGERLTVNAGLRWEPFLGQQVTAGVPANFSMENFQKGIRSKALPNMPAGFVLAGDAGFPSGRSGFNKQWWNLGPRVGLAWDVTGDSRLAVRSSYGIAYDLPTGQMLFVPANLSQWVRVNDPPGGFDDPFGHLPRSPDVGVIGPNSVLSPFGGFGVLEPDLNSPRTQQWNVTVERELAANWGMSVSYLGSYSDRLWGGRALNPGVYLGLDPCTLNGVFYSTCTTNANLDNRRVLSLSNPQEGQLISNLDLTTDLGTQNYRALQVSVRHRAARGLSLNGNYTWSRCFGLEMPTGVGNLGIGYTNPSDPSLDRGYCDASRTHIANLTMGAQTPQFANVALRALASNWRLSGILNARSGSWLNVITGLDNAFNGEANQRVNRLSEDVYGVKTLNNYLNRAAFAQPAPGTYGNEPRNSIPGPAFWNVDIALSRLVSFGAARSLEFRVETFNLLNHFNWGNPNTNFSTGTFGRITTLAGTPRIMQFGLKYSSEKETFVGVAGLAAAVAALSLVAVAAQTATPAPEAKWLDADRSEPARTSYRTFSSHKAGGDVSYLVYLPPDYETSGARRYPVVYWLHGLGGSQRSGAPFVKHLDAAIRAGKAPAMIAVLVNGLRDSRWYDSYDGKRPVESVFIRELIPHIDQVYRTKATPDGRMLEGYSMGGFGTARLGFKYPELFSAMSIMAGALLDDESVATTMPELFVKNFGANVAFFHAGSPWVIAERNAAKVRGKMAVRIGVGDQDSLLERNRHYHELLGRLKIEHEFFTVPGIGHDTGQFYDALGAGAFGFYQSRHTH